MDADALESALLPHLDAAYNLARWLTGSESDAEDVVQEACLRATRYFSGLRGADARPWFLAIVRNTSLTWLAGKRRDGPPLTFDEEAHAAPDPAPSPEDAASTQADEALLRAAIEELPAAFREALVLRELEGLSYREIASVTDAPIGTVMSRLARARERLQRSLARRMGKEG